MVIHDCNKLEMTADVHDHPYDGCGLLLLPSGAGLALTGILDGGRAPDGTDMVICNGGAHAVTVAHDSGDSAEGARFYAADGLDRVIPAYGQLRAVRVSTVAGRNGWWMGQAG